MKDISKLPKWAQDHIAGLNRDINKLKGTVKTLEWNPEDPDIYVDSWALGRHHLLKYSTIVFPTKGKKYNGEIQITRRGENSINIMYHGEGNLNIRPNVSNSIDIVGE